MAQNKVLVLVRDTEQYAKKLKALNLPEVDFLLPQSETEILEMAGRANILLANPTIAWKYINEVKHLKWMQSVFAGVDAMNGEGLRKDYLLTNVREVYGEPMAEYVLAYILMLEKEILETRGEQLKKVWNQRPPGLIKGKTMGVFGVGSIGKEIAKVAKAVGMRVLGFATEQRGVEYFDEVYVGEDAVSKFLAQCDYVVSVLPATADTDDFFDIERLQMMKKGAVFINIGRGNALIEEDLVQVLQSGHLRAAVLDVFKTEPLPEDSKLWGIKNVFITPHNSGYVINDKIFAIFTENYRHFNVGEDLIYQVDLTKGY